jgi:uncharacterized UBP type Zn finger protein
MKALMVCEHFAGLEPVQPRSWGCEECLKTGSPWVHLRLCLTCGHVGCCDSSPNRHAQRHFHETEHPVIASFEPGERWSWCYVDQAQMGVPDALETCLR